MRECLDNNFRAGSRCCAARRDGKRHSQERTACSRDSSRLCQTNWRTATRRSAVSSAKSRAISRSCRKAFRPRNVQPEPFYRTADAFRAERDFALVVCSSPTSCRLSLSGVEAVADVESKLRQDSAPAPKTIPLWPVASEFVRYLASIAITLSRRSCCRCDSSDHPNPPSYS